MRVIGLTGSLKTGKSTAAKMFARLGAKVISADDIAHEVIAPSGSGYKKIIKIFGAGILEKKRINRKKLAQIVFQDKKKLKILEKIIHPIVKQRIGGFIDAQKKKNGVIVLEVPLLFESGLHRKVDATIVVKASQNIQIKRAVGQLKIPKKEAIRRIKAQMPLKTKIRLANFIIDNGGTIKQTRKQVVKIWHELSSKTKKSQNKKTL
ncbi:MAG TPA: dephospho-CoA kinase [Candidatus Omnitrophota bacterium]|nr:dephospho-CoA kinase [Candidatus Omnitrophota bacterium]